MSELDMVVASRLETRVTLAGLLRNLKRTGELGRLTREALEAQYTQEQARQANLTVSDAELQSAADLYRQQLGLHSAADTQGWLAARGLTVEEFEANLEQDVRAAKFRQHLTAAQVGPYFAAHRGEFDQLRVVFVLAPREDQIRELATQIREEAGDLEALAREQGLPLQQLEKLRRELPGKFAEALASAEVGQLVGPVATPHGFALLLLRECKPAVLDAATSGRIQDELFRTWLTEQLKDATFRLPPTATL